MLPSHAYFAWGLFMALKYGGTFSINAKKSLLGSPQMAHELSLALRN